MPARVMPPSAVLAALAFAFALAGCGGASPTRAPSASAGSATLPAGLAGRPAPPIRLADARGGRIDTAALAGRPYAVTFLYTRCPDVCPLIGEEIRQALERLGPRARGVAVVAVSVDPRHDTPRAVRTWLARHREPPNFHYAVGTARELAPVWRGYFAAPQTPGDPESAHTAAIWLVDRHGRLAGRLSAGVPVDPAELAQNLSILTRRA